jgi:hypothetical protein
MDAVYYCMQCSIGSAVLSMHTCGIVLVASDTTRHAQVDRWQVCKATTYPCTKKLAWKAGRPAASRDVQLLYSTLLYSVCHAILWCVISKATQAKRRPFALLRPASTS